MMLLDITGLVFLESSGKLIFNEYPAILLLTREVALVTTGNLRFNLRKRDLVTDLGLK
jgi:hypothetical protein